MEDLTRQLAESMNNVAEAIDRLPEEIALRLRVDFERDGVSSLVDAIPKHEQGTAIVRFVRESLARMVRPGSTEALVFA